MNEVTARAIVAKVSERIGVTLTFRRDQDGDLTCTDPRGIHHTIIGYRWPKGFVVRGVVRQVRRGARWSWLCNGQVSNHGRQVAWWQESGEDSFVIPPYDLPSGTAPEVAP